MIVWLDIPYDFIRSINHDYYLRLFFFFLHRPIRFRGISSLLSSHEFVTSERLYRVIIIQNIFNILFVFTYYMLAKNILR